MSTTDQHQLKNHLSYALDILWKWKGNDFGGPHEKLIAEIQIELDRMNHNDTIATEDYLNDGPR